MPEHAFGSGRPFSLGVEEELFVVDPVTGRQANSSAAVIERLKPVRGDVTPVGGDVTQELHACEVELISEVHRTVGEAVGALRAMRGCGDRHRRRAAGSRHAPIGTRGRRRYH